jgi:hypothetical protein
MSDTTVGVVWFVMAVVVQMGIFLCTECCRLLRGLGRKRLDRNKGKARSTRCGGGGDIGTAEEKLPMMRKAGRQGVAGAAQASGGCGEQGRLGGGTGAGREVNHAAPHSPKATRNKGGRDLEVRVADMRDEEEDGCTREMEEMIQQRAKEKANLIFDQIMV